MAIRAKAASGKYNRDNKKYELISPSYEVLETVVVFAQTFFVLLRALGKVIRPVHVTTAQYAALWVLFVSDVPMTPTEIARHLPVRGPSVSPLLDRLQKRKLIRRRRSRSDRRVVEVTLTAEGEEMVRSMASAIRDVLTAIYPKTISNEELQILNRLQRKVRDAILPWQEMNPEYIESTVMHLSGAINSKPRSLRKGHDGGNR